MNSQFLSSLPCQLQQLPCYGFVSEVFGLMFRGQELSLTNCGQSFTSCGQSFTNCGQSFTNCGQSFTSCGQSFTNCRQSLTSCGQSFTSCGQSLTSCGQSFTTCGQSSEHLRFLTGKHKSQSASLGIITKHSFHINEIITLMSIRYGFNNLLSIIGIIHNRSPSVFPFIHKRNSNK